MDKTIPAFPVEMDSFPVDPMDLEKCCVSGLFKETIRLNGEGESYCLLTYLPTGIHNGAAHWVIIPPAAESPAAFFYGSGLQPLAEKENFFVHILCPPEAGSWEAVPNRKEYAAALLKTLNARTCYVGCASGVRAVYLLGAGDGGRLAYSLAATCAELFVGVCVYGAKQRDLSACAGEDNPPIPLWVWAEPEEQLPDGFWEMWKKRNCCQDEAYSTTAWDRIYLPRQVVGAAGFNDNAAAPLRISCCTDVQEEAGMQKRLPAIWKFLSRYRRYVGAGETYLRCYESPEAVGAEQHWMVHAGLRRRWYEYVPDAAPFESEKGYPLVVVLHGRGGTPENFFDSCRMWRVARQRRFIAVFPQAHCYQQYGPHGIRNVSMWNYPDGDLSADSIGFIRHMVEDVKGRYPVDSSRIYCCGQSSGGMMSVQMALHASDLFAAVASWSTGALPNAAIPITEPVIPVFLMRGELDGLQRQKEFPEYPFQCNTLLKGMMDYFLDRYGIEKKAKEYASGIYHYYVYEKEGVPLVTFSNVKDMPHANIAEESWLAYDLFLSKFSRGADGTLFYMGAPYRPGR